MKHFLLFSSSFFCLFFLTNKRRQCLRKSYFAIVPTLSFYFSFYISRKILYYLFDTLYVGWHSYKIQIRLRYFRSYEQMSKKEIVRNKNSDSWQIFFKIIIVNGTFKDRLRWFCFLNAFDVYLLSYDRIELCESFIDLRMMIEKGKKKKTKNSFSTKSLF